MKQGEAVNGALAVGHPSVQATADVDERAILGPGTTVWHLAQIRENARLGSGCVAASADSHSRSAPQRFVSGSAIHVLKRSPGTSPNAATDSSRR